MPFCSQLARSPNSLLPRPVVLPAAILLVLARHVVIHARELVQTVDLGDVTLHLLAVEFLAERLLDHVAQQRRRYRRIAVDADLVDARQSQARALGRVRRLRRGECRELVHQ